jgi:hypothetical protein
VSAVNCGSVPFTDDSSRQAAAAQIAGALAECGVARLTIADPRVCRTREVESRTTNLPGELSGAAPGTTIRGEGVALLVDDGCVRWVADEPIAGALRAIVENGSLGHG